MNYSRQRELILETLKENVVHPTAEYLYGKVHKKDNNISLATLYRNLNKLADEGIIKKIDGLELSSHYDHNTFEHYHFICEKCGKVFDIPSNIAKDLVKNTQQATGFYIKSYDIVFHGICKDCKTKEERN